MASFTLNNCPFCGIDSAAMTFKSGSQKHCVFCFHCKAVGPKMDSLGAAVESWNFRYHDRNTYEKLSTLVLEGKWKSVEEWARTGILP